jgi:thymidylate kinase
MYSVALIGPDGAGKTTVTRRLEQSGLLRCRYIYMGVNIGASNVALPTSRLAERLKGMAAGSATTGAERRTAVKPPWHKRIARRTHLRAVARLVNRLADAWFRQAVSWYYQLQGFVVLYDRHFVFDYAPEIAADQHDSFDRSLHRWVLRRFFPRPSLVIFLDAPGAVLFARKGESSIEELERRRQAFLRQGQRLRRFVRVDATKSPDDVYDEVLFHVLRRTGGERWLR